MTDRAGLFAALIVFGAGWGMTQPLAKIAVSEGYGPFGLIFWQLVIGALVMTALQAVRRKPLRVDGAALRVYCVIALIGTVLPNSASYAAQMHLPAGVISILLSLVPLFAFPMALALGNERFRVSRAAGLAVGLTGVLLLVGPEGSLPERAMVAFIPLALVAPLFYALEGNVVARWGTAGLGAISVLHGASLVGAVIALPLAVLSGQWIDPRPPYGAPDFALMISAVIHVLVYAGYVWLVGRAGAVFAVQVSYLVTGFGVLWAMMLLGERYTGWIWAAMALILAGVALVQPKPAPAASDSAQRRV